MSCSVHDVVRLERLRHPDGGVGTEPFVDEALEQARAARHARLPDGAIPHPVQLLTLDELRAQADAVFEQIVARLVRPGDGG